MLEECAVVRMRFLDIIEKKKNKLTLSDEEIQFWIDGVTDGTIPDQCPLDGHSLKWYG